MTTQTNIFLEERGVSPCILNGAERAIFLRWTEDGKKKPKAEVARPRSHWNPDRETFLVEPDSVKFADSWKVLVFDTETTGLPISWSAPASEVENWPRLVELAFTAADLDLESFDVFDFKSHEMIIQPDGFQIPEEASRVHGITTEKAILEGIPVSLASDRLSTAISEADFLVAHNMKFDEKIVGAEFHRLGEAAPKVVKIPKVCTMMNSTNFCRIPGRRGFKWPKLEELHEILFGEKFDGAHRAGADTEAALRCFVGLLQNNTIDLEKEVRKWL